MKKPGDPRVRRTRRRLHDALIELTIARGYDAVTVQDVLDHAETARSTFYAHFRDKDDLLLGGFRDRGHPLFGALTDNGCVTDPFARFVRGLFAHVHENRALAAASFGPDSAALLMGHLRNMIVVEARRLIAAQGGGDAGDGELAVQFLAGTAYSLLAWWIDHDFPIPIEEMAARCHRLITSGLAPGGAQA